MGSVTNEMDLESPDTWRWIWLVVATVLVVAEVATPVAFGFLPMALAAALAAILAFAGVSLGFEWLAFVLAAIAAYAALFPIGRRAAIGSGESSKVGAERWIGRQAVVTRAIPARGVGSVRLEREEWRAESGTETPIPAESVVLVTRLDGTRLVVVPLELAMPAEGEA